MNQKPSVVQILKSVPQVLTSDSPEYQNPAGAQAQAKGKTADMDLGPKAAADKPDFPKALPDQIAAVRAALSDLGQATPEQVARQFKRGRAATVQPLLESLTALGQAQMTDGDSYVI